MSTQMYKEADTAAHYSRDIQSLEASVPTSTSTLGVTAGNQNERSECNTNFRRDRAESKSGRSDTKRKRKSTSNTETEGSEGTAVSQTTTENEDSGIVESNVKRMRQRRSWAELNRSFTCSYEGCDRKYASNHALTLHERKKHENGGVFSTLRSVPQHWSHSSQQLETSRQHSSSQNYGNNQRNQHHNNVSNEVYSSNISQQTTQSSEDSSSPHSQQRDSQSSIALRTKNRPQNNSRQLTTQHINSQTARNSRDQYGRPSFAPQAKYRAQFYPQTTQKAGDLDARPSIAHGELSFAEHHSFPNEKCNYDSEAQGSGVGRQGGRIQDNYQTRMQVSQLALQYLGEPHNAQPQYETYKGYGDSGTAQRPQHGNLTRYSSSLNNTVGTTNTQENLSRTSSLANNAVSIGNRTMKQGDHAWNRGDNNLRWSYVASAHSLGSVQSEQSLRSVEQICTTELSTIIGGRAPVDLIPSVSAPIQNLFYPQNGTIQLHRHQSFQQDSHMQEEFSRVKVATSL